jgi:MerR family transcriptional regulator, light-induced transcriptional regulator
MFADSRRMVLDDLLEPSRRAILEQLRAGAKSVGMIVSVTGMKQPNVSNHLARMRERGVVSAHRAGRQVFYRLDDPVVRALIDVAGSTQPATDADALTSEELEMLSLRYYEAVVAGNEVSAGEVLNECIARRLKLETLYVDVLQEAMRRVGEWCELGPGCEAEEHVITALTERAIARSSLYFAADPPNGHIAVLGSAEGNLHTLGLRMIADVLQQRGWATHFVGAGVPHHSFLLLVRRRAPEIVLLSCTADVQAAATKSLIHDLREQRRTSGQPFLIGVGGRYVNACPHFATDAGADFTAPDARAFSQMVDRMYA